MIIICRRLLLLVLVVFAGCREAPEPPSADRSADEAPAARQGAAAGSAPADSAATADSSEEGPVVVFLGTSLTAGLGLADPEDAYPSEVDRMADSAGVPIRAVNAGVSGETSAGGLRRLDWVLRQPLDVLVLELGANDGLRGQDPAALEENLRAIVRQTRTRYPEARVLIAGMEAPTNLGTAYTEAFRTVFPRVAQETGSQLVPFLLEGVAGVAELNQEDGIHPTARGHRLMAERVWPYLEPLVRAEAASGQEGR